MLISAYHLYYICLHESLNSVNNLWYLPLHCRLTSQKACPGKEELLGSGWPGRGRENKKQLVPFLISQITTQKKKIIRIAALSLDTFFLKIKTHLTILGIF